MPKLVRIEKERRGGERERGGKEEKTKRERGGRKNTLKMMIL